MLPFGSRTDMGSALPKVDESSIGSIGPAGPLRPAAPSGKDRRRAARFPLGLPVGVQLAGRPGPITVELLDLSATGGRFRCLGEKVRVDETATVTFVLQDQQRCHAAGHVVRSDASGEFALRLADTNDAFVAFVSQLAE
jgi:hypothetical protein